MNTSHRGGTNSQRIHNTGNLIAIERPFDQIPANTFNLSHDVKTSCNIGELAPICVLECMPDDVFNIDTEALVRYQPMVAPVLHRQNVRTEWHFVPYRIIWPNWEAFISPSNEGDTPPSMPTINAVGAGGQPPRVHSLADYLNCPIETTSGASYIAPISALPFAAYEKIIWDWYKDENVNSMPGFVPLSDGNTNPHYEQAAVNGLQKRNWDKDYFTSCLPWPQKGPAVVIPAITSSVPVSLLNQGSAQNVLITGGGLAPVGSPLDIAPGTPGALDVSGSGFGWLDPNGTLGITPGDYALHAGTIEELRMAYAIQSWLEADARGGTRYIEMLREHFGAVSSDKRMQRAEYIGSTTQPIAISEVLQTSETSTTPQGTMAGHGIAVTKHSSGIHYRCEEHGIIIGIMSVLPATGYMQGLPRMFTRMTRLDFPWPKFANLGEQEVTNKELFYNFNPTSVNQNDDLFGYLPRYSEMRQQYNYATGDFRSTLNYWHMARLFPYNPSAPVAPPLDNAFMTIQNDASLNRIFAVTSSTVDHILCHWFHVIKVLRKLPRYVVPR